MMNKQALIAQVEDLQVGETHVRVERVPVEGVDAAQINVALQRVRNSMNQITNRLRKRSAAEFVVESASILSPDRNSVLCMAMTTKLRNGSENEDDDSIDI